MRKMSLFLQNHHFSSLSLPGAQDVLPWKMIARRHSMVHWTLGILAKSQVVFYTLAFFCSDGFAPSAPAPVTQSVGR